MTRLVSYRHAPARRRSGGSALVPLLLMLPALAFLATAVTLAATLPGG